MQPILHKCCGLDIHKDSVVACIIKTLVCSTLDGIGVENIAAKDGFPLEELSAETIIDANPDYIFVVTMGGEEAVNSSFTASLLSNPAFSSLSSVKNCNLIMLSMTAYLLHLTCIRFF